MWWDTNKGNNKHHTNITQVTNAAATEGNMFWVFKYLFSKYYFINADSKTDKLFKDQIPYFYMFILNSNMSKNEYIVY